MISNLKELFNSYRDEEVNATNFSIIFSMVVTEDLEDYLRKIKLKLDSLFVSLSSNSIEVAPSYQILPKSMKTSYSTQSQQEARIPPNNFSREIDLSDNRVLMLSNILTTIQSFPNNKYFYESSKNTPECMSAYYRTLVHSVIQSLDLKDVLSKIEETNARVGFWNIIYQNSIDKHMEIDNLQNSLVVDFQGTSYIIGITGISLQDYFLIYRPEKVPKADQDRFMSKESRWRTLYYYLKTQIAEGVAESFLMRIFRIPSLIWKKAMTPIPLGKTAFPDILIDTSFLTSENKQYIFRDFLKLSYQTQYICMDAKATVDVTHSSNIGSIRLRYTYAEAINSYLKNKIRVVDYDVISNDVSKEDFKPVSLSQTHFNEFVKFFVNAGYGAILEEVAGTKNVGTFEKTNLVLSDPNVTILYMEVGANSGSAPTIYNINIDKKAPFTILKENDGFYPIVNKMGVRVAKLCFYMGQTLNKAIKKYKKEHADEDPVFLKKIKDESAKDISKETQEMTEYLNTVTEVYSSRSSLVKKVLPVGEWLFMWKWDREALDKLTIPEYVPNSTK